MEQMLPPYASGILSIVYLKLNKIRLNLTVKGADTNSSRTVHTLPVYFLSLLQPSPRFF